MDYTSSRILVFDEERHQLDTVCRGLRLYGFRCLGVLTASEAFDAIVREEDDPFVLLLTDLDSSRGAQIDLIERVRATRPQMPIVVIAGLRGIPTLEPEVADGLIVLSKPFEPETLFGHIVRALDPR